MSMSERAFMYVFVCIVSCVINEREFVQLNFAGIILYEEKNHVASCFILIQMKTTSIEILCNAERIFFYFVENYSKTGHGFSYPLYVTHTICFIFIFHETSRLRSLINRRMKKKVANVLFVYV